VGNFFMNGVKESERQSGGEGEESDSSAAAFRQALKWYRQAANKG
jgi:hypothetical protein